MSTDSEDILEISTEDESKYPTTYKDLLELIPDVFEDDYSDEYNLFNQEIYQQQQYTFNDEEDDNRDFDEDEE